MTCPWCTHHSKRWRAQVGSGRLRALWPARRRSTTVLCRRGKRRWKQHRAPCHLATCGTQRRRVCGRRRRREHVGARTTSRRRKHHQSRLQWSYFDWVWRCLLPRWRVSWRLRGKRRAVHTAAYKCPYEAGRPAVRSSRNSSPTIRIDRRWSDQWLFWSVPRRAARRWWRTTDVAPPTRRHGWDDSPPRWRYPTLWAGATIVGQGLRSLAHRPLRWRAVEHTLPYRHVRPCAWVKGRRRGLARTERQRSLLQFLRSLQAWCHTVGKTRSSFPGTCTDRCGIWPVGPIGGQGGRGHGLRRKWRAWPTQRVHGGRGLPRNSAASGRTCREGRRPRNRGVEWWLSSRSWWRYAPAC